MKLSRYTLLVDDYPEKGKSIAFHTRTQAIVKLNQEMRDLLGRLSVVGFRLSGLQPQSQENLKTLHEMGIVVKDEQEEKARLGRPFSIQRLLRSLYIPISPDRPLKAHRRLRSEV